VFHSKDIEAAIQKGVNYDPESEVNKNPFAVDFGRAMGIDPAYGSSSFWHCDNPAWVDNDINNNNKYTNHNILPSSLIT